MSKITECEDSFFLPLISDFIIGVLIHVPTASQNNTNKIKWLVKQTTFELILK